MEQNIQSIKTNVYLILPFSIKNLGGIRSVFSKVLSADHFWSTRLSILVRKKKQILEELKMCEKDKNYYKYNILKLLSHKNGNFKFKFQTYSPRD
jgi:hypothetical protein